MIPLALSLWGKVACLNLCFLSYFSPRSAMSAGIDTLSFQSVKAGHLGSPRELSALQSPCAACAG